MFEQVAAEYDRRYGLDAAHLRAIGELNLANAQGESERADPELEAHARAASAEDDEPNPVVAGRLRRNDCCQITDGGAGIVLVSARWLREHGREGEGSRITGWGHQTVGLPMAPKLERSRGRDFVMPHVRKAITDAWSRAGIAGVDDLDLIETHDCMTPSEYMAIDHFGITPPGKSWQAIESGALARDGRIPVNPSGGLIGGGHPVGATGVRMLVDAASQVCGRGGRDPGRGRAARRHAQHRRQHRDHRQLRRRTRPRLSAVRPAPEWPASAGPSAREAVFSYVPDGLSPHRPRRRQPSSIPGSRIEREGDCFVAEVEPFDPTDSRVRCHFHVGEKLVQLRSGDTDPAGARLSPQHDGVREPHLGLLRCAPATPSGFWAETATRDPSSAPSRTTERRSPRSVLGAVAGRQPGRAMNVADFAPSEPPSLSLPGSDPLVVAVVGSRMDCGKSTTIQRITAGLRRQGLRVGAGKLTGFGCRYEVTGAGRRLLSRFHRPRAAIDLRSGRRPGAANRGVDPRGAAIGRAGRRGPRAGGGVDRSLPRRRGAARAARPDPRAGVRRARPLRRRGRGAPAARAGNRGPIS